MEIFPVVAVQSYPINDPQSAAPSALSEVLQGQQPQILSQRSQWLAPLPGTI